MKFLSKFLTFTTAIAVLSFPAAASAASNFQLTVIHGINGADLGLPTSLNVDVFVNGARALDNVQFKGVASGISLPAGTYSIEVRLDLDGINDSGDESTAVGPTMIRFRRDERATVIAHLDANGAPTASKFTDNVHGLTRNTSRLVLHHTAAAPAVDVYAGFGRIFLPISRHLVNGNKQTRLLPARTYPIAVTPAGTLNVVLGPANFDLAGRKTYLVYVVGSVNAARNSLDVIVVPVQP